jgi:uncharacterized membrane protein YkoI
VKQFVKRKWVVPVAALVLTFSIGTAAFAATGSSSTDTTAAGASTAVTSTATAGTATSDAAAATTATTATGTAPGTATAPDSTKPWGNQRSDETLLTGDTLTKVQAAAVAKASSDATVVRVETDADGNAAYEVHMVKADGTLSTVYVDESFTVVSVQDGPAGGGHGDHQRGPDKDSNNSSSSTSSSSTTN